jgi:diguanylate cyclase (GGDEF)-like protein/PAS domain S-box-containing protein
MITPPPVTTGPADPLTDADCDLLRRQLAQAQQRCDLLQAIIDTIPDGQLLLEPRTDPSGQVVDFLTVAANGAADTLLATPMLASSLPRPDQSPPRTLLELFPDRKGQLQAALVTTLGTGADFSADDWLMSSGPEHRWFDVRASRVQGRLSVSLRDVTERHNVAARLQQSQERYRVLAENAADIVVQADLRGVMGWVSPSVRQVLGWNPDELPGRHMAALVHPDDLGAHAGVGRELRAGRPVSVRSRMMAVDGSYHWMDTRISPLLEPSGLMVGMTAASRDVDAQVRSEQALIEAEARFRMVAENVGDFVLQTSPEGVIQWVTPSVASVIGWSPEDLVGRVATDFADASVRSAAKESVAATFAGDVVRGRTRVICKDGSRRWIGFLLRPLKDAAGQITGRVSSWWDVQAQMDAEQALAREKQRTEAVLDTLLDPHLTVAPVRQGDERDWVLTRVNPAACLRLGASREQLMGARLSELVRGPAWRELCGWLDQVADGGPPVQAQDVRIPSGAGDDGDRWFDGNAVWVGGEISIVWRDVTDRNEAAAIVAATRDRYQLLAENASDVVFRDSADGTLEWISPSVADLLGWRPEELIGRRLIDRVHPLDVAAADNAVGVIERGDPAKLEARVRTAGGEYRWLAFNARPIRDEQGRIAGRVGSCHDITAAHTANEELRFLATHDPMTRLANRAEAFTVLNRLLSHSRGATATAVLYADLDDLKSINDTFGHAAGDAAIIETANRIQAAIRSGDTAARIGGDEYLVLLPGITTPSAAETVAAKIRTATSQPLHWRDIEIPIGLSIGIHLAGPGEDPEAAIAEADAASYTTKRRRLTSGEGGVPATT